MKKLIRNFLSLGAVAALAAPAWSLISVSLDIESVKDAQGANMASSGLLVLVVDTEGNGFSFPVEGEIVPAASDDEVVAMWDLADAGINNDAFNLLAGGIEYGAEWSPGDPVALFWFPGLTLANQIPGADEAFGFFTDSNGLMGGDDWALPADGALLFSLRMFTSDADQLVAPEQAAEVPVEIAYAGYKPGDSPQGPMAPDTIGAGQTGSSVVVSWENGSAKVGGYRVERRRAGSGDDWTVLGFVGDDVTQWVDDYQIVPAKAFEYRVFAINGFGSQVSSASAPLTTLRSRLINISTRGVIGAEDQVMIPGFVIRGDGEKKLMARGLGPSAGLEPGIRFAPDPEGLLVGGPLSNKTLVNIPKDDWQESNGDELVATAAAVGAGVLQDGSTDVAILATATRGLYTFTVGDQNALQDPDGIAGVAVVEVFDANDDAIFDVFDQTGTRFINVSTRGPVGLLNEQLIGGFVVRGQVNMTVLIRAVAETLGAEAAEEGETVDFLPDPIITVNRLFPPATGKPPEVVGVNNDWETPVDGLPGPDQIDEATAMVTTRLLTAGGKESALLLSLPRGRYSVNVDSNVDGDDGLVLMEVYEIEPETPIF